MSPLDLTDPPELFGSLFCDQSNCQCQEVTLVSLIQQLLWFNELENKIFKSIEQCSLGDSENNEEFNAVQLLVENRSPSSYVPYGELMTFPMVRLILAKRDTLNW
jgi:hypothetical protein